jgi:predicted metal-dependent hydrolase
MAASPRRSTVRGTGRAQPLFPPEAFAKARARSVNAHPRLRRAREDENSRLMARLHAISADLSARFGLRYRALEREQDGVVGHYGICYADGMIRIRLRHAVTGRPLKESSLVDTLCHELAHLRYFDHSPAFKNYYFTILEEARRLGYYRPGRGPSAGNGGCGLFETEDPGR